MISIYNITTVMGEIYRCLDINPLPFLTNDEIKEFNSIGYSGKTSNGEKISRKQFLNSLGKGHFEMICKKFDNGDFKEKFEIIRVIPDEKAL